MPTSPTPDFQSLVQEQRKKNDGIDFQRAYRALIRGFVRAKTTEGEKETRKSQNACKTHL
jgi:hypothetical protein